MCRNVWLFCSLINGLHADLNNLCFIDCQILYIQYLLNRWPYLNLCLLRELPLMISLKGWQCKCCSLQGHVIWLWLTPPPPSHFSISSSSSYAVFSAFVRSASLFDLGESHPVQHFSWLSLGSGSKTLLSLYPNHSHKCICIQQKEFSSY